jgi:hypothetical protein
LAKHGVPAIEPTQFAQLPLYLAERQAVVSVGMPPYAYWQPNPEIGLYTAEARASGHSAACANEGAIRPEKYFMSFGLFSAPTSCASGAREYD